MKLPLVALATALLASCATPQPKKSANVERFYKEAKVRASTGLIDPKIDLRGLRYTLGSLPGTRHHAGGESDSILVSDIDPSIRQAVQVIVKPRVSGSFADMAQPSEEFLLDLKRSTETALRRHRYSRVEIGLLPDPSPLDLPAAPHAPVLQGLPVAEEVVQ